MPRCRPGAGEYAVDYPVPGDDGDARGHFPLGLHPEPAVIHPCPERGHVPAHDHCRRRPQRDAVFGAESFGAIGRQLEIGDPHHLALSGDRIGHRALRSAAVRQEAERGNPGRVRVRVVGGKDQGVGARQEAGRARELILGRLGGRRQARQRLRALRGTGRGRSAAAGREGQQAGAGEDEDVLHGLLLRADHFCCIMITDHPLGMSRECATAAR